jgi:hypothetical protein
MIDCHIFARWIFDWYLMNAGQLPDDCLMIPWWFPDNTWWLLQDSLMTMVWPAFAAKPKGLDFMDPVSLGSVLLALATVGAQDVPARRLRYRAIENDWWLPKDCQLFLRWMFHDCWMTAGQLSDDCLMVPWQSPDDCFKTALWQLPIVFGQLTDDCMTMVWPAFDW